MKLKKIKDMKTEKIKLSKSMYLAVKHFKSYSTLLKNKGRSISKLPSTK